MGPPSATATDRLRRFRVVRTGCGQTLNRLPQELLWVGTCNLPDVLNTVLPGQGLPGFPCSSPLCC